MTAPMDDLKSAVETQMRHLLADEAVTVAWARPTGEQAIFGRYQDSTGEHGFVLPSAGQNDTVANVRTPLQELCQKAVNHNQSAEDQLTDIVTSIGNQARHYVLSPRTQDVYSADFPDLRSKGRRSGQPALSTANYNKVECPTKQRALVAGQGSGQARRTNNFLLGAAADAVLAAWPKPVGPELADALARDGNQSAYQQVLTTCGNLHEAINAACDSLGVDVDAEILPSLQTEQRQSTPEFPNDLTVSTWGITLVDDSQEQRHVVHFQPKLGTNSAPADRQREATAVHVVKALWGQRTINALDHRFTLIHISGREGSFQQVFDGTPADLVGFKKDWQQRAANILSATERRPGPACADCPERTDCSALPHEPGVLGFVTKVNLGVAVTGSGLPTATSCPERLRMDHMINQLTAREEHPAATIGTAVHRILAQRHALGRCQDATLTDDEVRVVENDGADPGVCARLIAAHFAVCEQVVPSDCEIYTEASYHFYEPMCDATVTVRPDMVAIGSVYRLVDYKTSSKSICWDPNSWREVMDHWPVAALYVVLAHARSLGLYRSVIVADDAAQCLEPILIKGSAEAKAEVVMEMITPSRSHVLTLDADDPQILAAARQIVADGVATLTIPIQDMKPSPSECSICVIATSCSDSVSKTPA